jgi:hypothetical protein
MGLIAGEEPPSNASLRALSRSMRDFSASLTRADFSATPVHSWAMRTRSSSSVSVVLMMKLRASISASPDVDFVIRAATAFAMQADTPSAIMLPLVALYFLGCWVRIGVKTAEMGFQLFADYGLRTFRAALPGECWRPAASYHTTLLLLRFPCPQNNARRRRSR